MSFKKSYTTVKMNEKIWTNNLTNFKKSTTKRREIPNMENSLSELCKIPKQIAIIGRFNALAKLEKNKTKRFKLIATELKDLWLKLNFPIIANTSVERKIEKLLDNYSKFLKYRNGKSLLIFDVIFDITKLKGTWLSTEDKKLYELLKSTNGTVGYTTSKTIAVHPSKTAMLNRTETCINNLEEQEQMDLDSTLSTSINDDSESIHGDVYELPTRMKVKMCSTAPAVSLVNTLNVSTNKASKICKELIKSGVSVPTPSQSGVYKAAKKSAEGLEQHYKNTLQNEEWCLHFDGKKIDNKEIQVVVLKNELREVRLAVLVLKNGKGLTIFEGIKNVLDNFKLWNSIKMIITDTTSVNTGNKNGVVYLLCKQFTSLALPPPQYIGCQHHVLDLVLRHVMDELLDGKSTSPNISYDVFTELISDYEVLKKNYKQNTEVIRFKRIKWRDDMQYLFELGESFRYYEKNNDFPYIKFKAIPPISNARWNSRAILSFLTFILIPKYREKLLPICKFISAAWYDVWFSDHCFREDNFDCLEKSIKEFKKAHKCFLKHWVKENSVIKNQQRSNICAERAIKVVNEIYPRCKTTSTLNLKFISTNNLMN